MLALEINNNILPVVYDRSFSQPQLNPVKLKPETAIHTLGKVTNKAPVQRAEFSAMGIVIPFQPTLWDDKKEIAAWKEAIEMVRKKMKDKYAVECSANLIARLNKMFGRLNFNTHRKSLALILTPAEEKMFYLDFPVKPVVFFRKSISVLDLAANILQEADFYYLVFHKSSVSLYDYCEGKLRKVSEQKQESDIKSFLQKAFSTTELLNSRNEKPVFVTGSPNLVELFCSSYDSSGKYFPLLYYATPYSDAEIGQIVKEIISHWNYWQTKFVRGRVLEAQQAGRLVSHAKAVLQLLRKSSDGLLLIDKRVKQQLQKPETKDMFFNTARELMVQLEKFLTKGNRIEITNTGVLKNMGGIALLVNVPRHSSEMIEHKQWGASARGDMF